MYPVVDDTLLWKLILKKNQKKQLNNLGVINRGK